jgi:hypothetical protein
MTDKSTVTKKLNDIKKEIIDLRAQCESKKYYFDGF